MPKYAIFVRFGESIDICDYAEDYDELRYLLTEYHAAYNGYCEFKVLPISDKRMTSHENNLRGTNRKTT